MNQREQHLLDAHNQAQRALRAKAFLGEATRVLRRAKQVVNPVTQRRLTEQALGLIDSATRVLDVAIREAKL